MLKVISLSMVNTIADLGRLAEQVDEFLESCSLPQRLVYGVNLVLEEVLTNIIKYAFDDDDEHHVGVRLEVNDDGIIIECRDGGKEFDPLALPPPQLKDNIEECEVGGLGIHLVRKTVDSIEYRRINDMNILTMRIGVRGD